MDQRTRPWRTGYRAVIFDLDGVLINTENAVVALWQDVAASRGVHPSGAQIRTDVIGCTPEHTVTALFAEADHDAVLSEIRAAEPDLPFDVTPGSSELLGQLTAAGIPVALVTSASAHRVKRVLDGLGGVDAFHCTVSWGEPRRGKPAPDPYLLAAARLGVDPARCVVFEDAVSGVISAVSAGAYCIGVGSDGDELRDRGASTVVRALTDVRVVLTDAQTQLAAAGTVLPLAATDQAQRRRG